MYCQIGLCSADLPYQCSLDFNGQVKTGVCDPITRTCKCIGWNGTTYVGSLCERGMTGCVPNTDMGYHIPCSGHGVCVPDPMGNVHRSRYAEACVLTHVHVVQACLITIRVYVPLGTQAYTVTHRRIARSKPVRWQEVYAWLVHASVTTPTAGLLVRRTDARPAGALWTF